MKLTLGFSPCPNDTFIFDALVNRKLDTGGLELDYVLEDVETLNRWADEGKLDITKLSYSAFLRNTDRYGLLRTGSALGKGVGPLLVSLPEIAERWQEQTWRKTAKLAIPGINTTANLLLTFAYPDIQYKTEVVFNEIEQAVLDRRFDAGLIIHESRFTYEAKGLVKLADLGDWWEGEMNAPIPLGGIVIKRSIDRSIAERIDRLLRKSLDHSWKSYPVLSDFVERNAQEMDAQVMRRHIELYVNNYTSDLGGEGTAAIEKLFAAAKKTGLIQGGLPVSLFR